MLLSDINANERVDVIVCTDGVDIKNHLVGNIYSVMTADNGEEVIGVFHNYVNYGKCKSILSKSQCEAASVKVDDRPVKFG